MSGDREELIRQRAYALWEKDGGAHGRHDDHWAQAVREIEGGPVPNAKRMARSVKPKSVTVAEEAPAVAKAPTGVKAPAAAKASIVAKTPAVANASPVAKVATGTKAKPIKSVAKAAKPAGRGKAKVG